MSISRQTFQNFILLETFMYLCSHFQWEFEDFVCGNLSLKSIEFLRNFCGHVENDDWSAAQLLAEILRIMGNDFTVLFTDGRRLSMSELNCT